MGIPGPRRDMSLDGVTTFRPGPPELTEEQKLEKSEWEADMALLSVDEEYAMSLGIVRRPSPVRPPPPMPQPPTNESIR